MGEVVENFNININKEKTYRMKCTKVGKRDSAHKSWKDNQCNGDTGYYNLCKAIVY